MKNAPNILKFNIISYWNQIEFILNTPIPDKKRINKHRLLKSSWDIV